MIGYRLCWAPSAGIKATVNGEMSVACPATRRDGRRRIRLRERKLETSNCESENIQSWEISKLSLQTWVFKLETSKCETENLQSWEISKLSLQTAKVRNFKLRKWKSSNVSLQTWNLKLRKWKSSKLRAESFQLLSFDKLQVLKLRIRTACSKVSYQSWMLKVVEHWKCWILKVC